MKRGFALVEIIVVLAIAVGALFVAKPAIFPGQSRRADKSTTATERLETATNAQGGTVAASVTEMVRANGMTDPSPARDFISREGTLALSLLPAPDPKAQLEAEKRRVAVMEGQRDEARRLYESAAKTADRLLKERDEALTARRQADLALEKAAAAEHARTLQMAGLAFVAVLGLGAWGYLKFFWVPPAAIGRALADVDAGESVETALSMFIPTRLHKSVRNARKLATEPKKTP
jgi:prepilin-type N-terminal cleavage/methylation domain-containing protein